MNMPESGTEQEDSGNDDRRQPETRPSQKNSRSRYSDGQVGERDLTLERVAGRPADSLCNFVCLEKMAMNAYIPPIPIPITRHQRRSVESTVPAPTMGPGKNARFTTVARIIAATIQAWKGSFIHGRWAFQDIVPLCSPEAGPYNCSFPVAFPTGTIRANGI